MINSRLREQVFYTEECRPPAPGVRISFTPDLESFKPRLEFAEACMLNDRGGPWRVHYKQVGLAEHEVLAVDLMSDVEREHAVKRAAALRLARMANFARNLDTAPQQRRDNGAPAGDAAATEAAAGDDIHADPLDLLDQELEAAIADPEDAFAALPDEDVQEMWVECEDGADTDLTEESEGEEDPDAGLPILDMEGQVHNPGNYADIWGKISIIREGLPGEAMSVYCRRHGCSFVKSTKDAIATPDVLRWFLLGQDLPKDRSAATQRRQKLILNELG